MRIPLLIRDGDGKTLLEAGLTPYRVDRDPGVSIPTEELSTQIAESDACLCDISTDTPCCGLMKTDTLIRVIR
jgi:hypothetical protein